MKVRAMKNRIFLFGRASHQRGISLIIVLIMMVIIGITAASAMRNATNQHDFTQALNQADAFITAALDYEFIDLSEKAVWLDEMAAVVRIQTIGESA